jgi:hypothetical protein
MDEMRSAYKILVGSLRRREQSEDVGVGGRIILNGYC